MIYLAVQTVHTSGINVASIATIGGSVAAMLGIVLVIISRISNNVRREIQESVQHLADVLDERLATKQQVNDLETKVAVISAKQDFYHPPGSTNVVIPPSAH